MLRSDLPSLSKPMIKITWKMNVIAWDFIGINSVVAFAASEKSAAYHGSLKSVKMQVMNILLMITLIVSLSAERFIKSVKMQVMNIPLMITLIISIIGERFIKSSENAGDEYSTDDYFNTYHYR